MSFFPITLTLLFWKSLIILAYHACMLSHFSHIRLFANQWTVAPQVPLIMGYHFANKGPPGQLCTDVRIGS